LWLRTSPKLASLVGTLSFSTRSLSPALFTEHFPRRRYFSGEIPITQW
jgi:hypothetical protein